MSVVNFKRHELIATMEAIQFYLDNDDDPDQRLILELIHDKLRRNIKTVSSEVVENAVNTE